MFAFAKMTDSAADKAAEKGDLSLNMGNGSWTISVFLCWHPGSLAEKVETAVPVPRWTRVQTETVFLDDKNILSVPTNDSF